MQIGQSVSTRQVTKTADGSTIRGDATVPIPLLAGHTVTDWVKTDAETAACNLAAGHGQTTGVYDVYTSAGAIIRYGVTGTVTVDALALDGGTVPTGGVGFPDSATVGIIVCKQQQVNIDIDGDLAEGVKIELKGASGHADFQDVSSGSVRALSLDADEFDGWDSDMAVNPYTGNPITKVLVSNGTLVAGTVEIAVLQDSTP
jgi:hypothetical protein